MNAVDANVLVYAVTADDAAKQGVALKLLARLSETDTVMLWQVLCESGAVLSRLRARGRAPEDAAIAWAALRRRFPVALPRASVLDLGWRIHSEQQVSYWDAMLLAACAEAGVTRLYTEDLQSAPKIAGIEIVNPFA